MLEGARTRGAEAKEQEEAAIEGYDLTAREAEQRVRRAGRGAERAAELVRESWRSFEEFQLAPALALEALFIELRRAFSGVLAAS